MYSRVAIDLLLQLLRIETSFGGAFLSTERRTMVTIFYVTRILRKASQAEMKRHFLREQTWALAFQDFIFEHMYKPVMHAHYLTSQETEELRYRSSLGSFKS